MNVAGTTVEKVNAVLARKLSVAFENLCALLGGRREVMVKNQCNAVGIAHRLLDLVFKDICGDVTAQIMQKQGVNVCNNNFARLDR